VTGGKDSSSTTTTSSGNNDQLVSTLQGISSGLKDLGKNQNQSLFGGQNGLMFATMALALSRRNDNVVVVNGGGGGHYWWHRRGW
jgi:hypothetical protein